jgi:hypothetical protein
MTSEKMLGFFAFIGILALLALVGLLIAWPIKWCWNYTMPYLFALPVLTWGKAWCLYFLAGCLIKSIHTHQKD